MYIRLLLLPNVFVHGDALFISLCVAPVCKQFCLKLKRTSEGPQSLFGLARPLHILDRGVCASGSTQLVKLRNRIAISKSDRSMVALKPTQLWVYGGVLN